MNIKSILLTSIIFSTYSCANYINKIHRELDRDMYAQEQKKYNKQNPDNYFDQYKVDKNKPSSKKIYHPASQRPLSQKGHIRNSTVINSGQRREAPPTIKRQYTPEYEAKRRYKAQDMVDNHGGASLWAGKGRANYLLSNNNEKRDGDIILINVNKRLKDEMTVELKRIFPDPPTRNNQNPNESAPSPDSQASTGNQPGPSPASASAQAEVFDRISSVIIEKVNSEHYLLRGRKHVLHKNFKRLVEVQALISKKDIVSDNIINSDDILETSVTVIR